MFEKMSHMPSASEASRWHSQRGGTEAEGAALVRSGAVNQGCSSQWLAIISGENVKYPFGERSEPMAFPSRLHSSRGRKPSPERGRGDFLFGVFLSDYPGLHSDHSADGPFCLEVA